MKIHPRNFVPFALTLAALVFNSSFFQSVQAASWTTNCPLQTARYGHTATLLPNGRVIVVGGRDVNGVGLASAELFDPATGKWMITGSLNFTRYDHTATLLTNGKLMVVGGIGIHAIPIVELYDPATGVWTTNTLTLNTARFRHTATLLSDGKVLVAGGGNNGFLSSSEVFDPATGAWTPTVNSLAVPRVLHTATLLTNGKVLVAGGACPTGITNSVDLFDPVSGMWTTVNPMNLGRYRHIALSLPNGLLMVAGGAAVGQVTNSVEVFDPAAGTWTKINSMKSARIYHAASLLPNGNVLVTGGDSVGNAVEIYDASTGTWTTTNAMKAARQSQTATMLPNGKVLVAGGTDSFFNPTNSTEVFEYALGTWTNTGEMTFYRSYHTATLLPDGNVLVAGNGGGYSSAELYNPANGTWTNTGSLNAGRGSPTATLLPNGKVLVSGGFDGVGYFIVPLASAELYDPASRTWSLAGTMTAARAFHSATLLPNGKVLVVGGQGSGNSLLSSAELYDPASNTWKSVNPMATTRASHTAMLLKNGKVLIAGGLAGLATNYVTLASAELFDPASGIWTPTGSLITPRAHYTLTMLPNGKLLAAGGVDMFSTSGTGGAGMLLSSAELFDPLTGIWTVTGSMSTFREYHAATLLPIGKVLVAGNASYSPSSELFDPATGAWTATGDMTDARFNQTATLLPNGKVLVTGGMYPGGGNPYSSAALYDVGMGYANTSRPKITGVTSSLKLGTSLVVTGAQFRGVGEGSSGNAQSSSTDFPLVQLRSLESGQTLILSSTNWGTNTFSSLPVWNFPPGYALATVFVNGIQSTSSIVNISVPIPTAPILTSSQKINGSFQFAFTNNVGALFGVLTTTNLSQPRTNWTALGGVIEVAPGQFQFTDPQATNNPQRFYQIRSP